MRVIRLAQLFEYKYGLKSEASTQEKFDQVKKELVRAYRLYVDSKTAKEPVLQMLANIKEPFSKKLISSMENMVDKINTISASDLYFTVNNMLSHINHMKNDEDNATRNRIHNSIKVTKESERNYREHFKAKFEMIVSTLSSILEKQAKVLQTVADIKEPHFYGGAVSPQRKELSKDKLLMFMRSPAAQQYGLDSMEVMTQILAKPFLRSELTDLINAIDRGQIPINGPDVSVYAERVAKQLKEQQSTNQPFFEGQEAQLQRQKDLEGMTPGEYQIDKMKQVMRQKQEDQAEEGEDEE
jgi:hypothetical protein